MSKVSLAALAAALVLAFGCKQPEPVNCQLFLAINTSGSNADRVYRDLVTAITVAQRFGSPSTFYRFDESANEVENFTRVLSVNGTASQLHEQFKPSNLKDTRFDLLVEIAKPLLIRRQRKLLVVFGDGFSEGTTQTQLRQAFAELARSSTTVVFVGVEEGSREVLRGAAATCKAQLSFVSVTEILSNPQQLIGGK